MALYKTLSAHYNEKKEWVEQQHVEMHPKEEARIRAQWAVGDSAILAPKPITLNDEHEWLIEFGPEYVKQKRAEYKIAHDKWMISHQPLLDAHKIASDEYMKWADSLSKEIK